MTSYKRFIITFLFFFTVISAFAQQSPRIKKSRFVNEDKNYKVAWKAVKAGNEYYRKGLGTYNLALEKYWIALDYNDANAALHYRIGVCYIFTGRDKTKALFHIKKAYEIDPYVASDINYLLGRVYHLNLQFDMAIKEYENYQNSLTPRQKKKSKIDTEKLIAECKYGMELVANPRRIILQNLGKNVNTSYDDYNSIILQDKRLMYFTSRRPSTTKGRRCVLDNKFYEDVYLSKLDKENWSEASNVQLGKKINTKQNDAIQGFSHSNTKMYIYKGDKKGGSLYVSTNKKNEWRKPKPIKKVLRTKERETAMFMTPDNNTIYFISKRKDSSVGGKDIFYSKKASNGKWERPQNLSLKVNTPYDEEGLYLDPSGDTLFFSSKGHNSMGGFDVFRTTKDAEGNWNSPVNLGYPINSPEDDLYYKVGENAKIAYLSTVRDEGLGGLDMFKLIYLGAEKEFLFSKEEDTLAWFVKPINDLFYKMPQKLEIDSTLYLIGQVTDANSNQPIVAKLQLIDREKSMVVATTISEESGNYKIKLPDKKAFGVEINATGYMFFIDTIDLSQEQFLNDIAIRNFTLDKVEVGAKMILKNIYFDTGKATLKSESYPELNRVAQFLKDNPTIKIEISGHTDNIGAYALNKKLSRERAKSVVDYLTGQEITKGRLQFEGYAYDQPIAPNNTEEGRSLNRRVEFKILSTK
jgi:outer membrane protein OmpA-like peptidoglycan-associated protein